MPPEKHALLSASSAHRWMTCTRSAREEEKYPEEQTSEAAEEGRLAHELAEDHLRKILDGKRVTTPKKLKENPLYRPAMEEHVATYCDVIAALVNGLKDAGKDPIVYIEQKLDLSEWVKEGFGTADCIVIADGELHVFDFKYGKGVPVNAEENPQLKLYGRGALLEFSLLYQIDTVVLHIIQPRLDSITEWSVSADVLCKWSQFVVKPIAEKAFKGEGEFVPGEEQCRFCRAKNRCKAYNSHLLEIAKARFDVIDDHQRDPNELTDEEIAEMLKSTAEIKRWCTSVEEYALDQALNHGASFPGFKIVEGISRRKIVDEAKALERLESRGFTTAQVMTLKGITALEEEVGKTRLADIIGEYIQKPPGKPTLVPEKDKREAITDFTVFEKEN